MVWPALGLGEPSDLQKHRFNWNAPIVVSSHDPNVIYHAGNILFRSRDRGKNWEAISGDLTRNDKATQGPGGGPITNEGAGGEVYNTIFLPGRVAEGRHGVVGRHRRRLAPPDARWRQDVDEPHGRRRLGTGLVNAIEASPHDPAVAMSRIARIASARTPCSHTRPGISAGRGH